MLFNSFAFALFLPVVFLLYWRVTRTLQQQNILLLIASYFFYGCWDWRFLFLLAFSTFLDFFTGLKIMNASTRRNKQLWLWLSITINLGFLGFFKYYNFFVTSFAEAISNLGLHVNPWTLSVILPVGISFYTFHGLSYVFDIYHGKIKAERNFVEYALFVSFFPLLVAGPIERATHLLPQIKEPRKFEYSKMVDGLRQILWGLFKKIIIAEQSAQYVNLIFSDPSSFSGSTLLLGVVFFAFQIYGDFSGYSDIALGTARLFGIELLRNFAYPYFSRDIAEFWRRWHISLSSWFRDYLYIPLGGSKGGTWMKVRNTFIIFLVSGFWHGANWTFIVWGALNAIYFMPLLLTNKNRDNLQIVAAGKTFPTFRELFSMLLTFGLTCFAWIFFRAKDMSHALAYIKHMFSRSLFSTPYFYSINDAKKTLLFILFFLIVEWMGREQPYAIAKMGNVKRRYVRWLSYYAIIWIIINYSTKEQTFIYFQF